MLLTEILVWWSSYSGIKYKGRSTGSQQNTPVAKRQINLEKANRKIDLGIMLEQSATLKTTNEIAPSPTVNAEN